MIKPSAAMEQVRYWRRPELGRVELLQARYRRQNFGPHFHRCYAFGVIEAGAMAFNYLGRKFVASAGKVNLVCPGETHDGSAAGPDGWRYRMIYLGPDIVIRAAEEAFGRAATRPFFNTGVVVDPEAALSVGRLHRAMTEPGVSRLERESLLLEFLIGFISRHAETKPRPWAVGDEPRAVALAREFIEDRLDQNVSLDQLSDQAGLSRFHLIRVFRRQVGLTPHAYLTQRRLCRAKDLLDQDRPIAEVALETGFSDQSHLNRAFKKIHGITPGQYRNMIQD